MSEHLSARTAETTWTSIEDLIVKTCIAVEPFMMENLNKTASHRSNCFELYGFDVLLDEHLKPWLIEVNVCPSLSSSSPLDRQIKTTMISDVLHLVGFVPYSKTKGKGKGKLRNQSAVSS